MDQSEFDRCLGQIGCTGAKLAEWLGVRPLTVTRWRTGTVAVPGPAALAIRALASGWREGGWSPPAPTGPVPACMEEALRAIVTETEGTKTSKGIAIRGIALRALGEKEGKA